LSILSLNYAPPSVCATAWTGIGETNDPGASGAAIDATQYAHAVGAGSTLDASGKMVSSITASSQNKKRHGGV